MSVSLSSLPLCVCACVCPSVCVSVVCVSVEFFTTVVLQDSLTYDDSYVSSARSMVERVQLETGLDDILVARTGMKLCRALERAGSERPGSTHASFLPAQTRWFSAAQPGTVAFFGNAAKWDFLSYLAEGIRLDKSFWPFYLAYVADMCTVPVVLELVDPPGSTCGEGGPGPASPWGSWGAWEGGVLSMPREVAAADEEEKKDETAELLKEACAAALGDKEKALRHKYEHFTGLSHDLCSWAVER